MDKTVTETNVNGLEQHMYRFYLDDRLRLFLDRYDYSERPSKRHKFRSIKHWSRVYGRDNNIPQPELSPWIVDAALDQARSQVEYCPKFTK